MSENSQLERLVQAIHSSAKYCRVSEELVRDIGSRELTKHATVQDAIKATKTKLHQVAGAYLSGREQFGSWQRELGAAYESGRMDAIEAASINILRHHSSTRERIPILDHVFSATLGGLAPIRTLIDVACGLNPLALPWMPLCPSTEYTAYDIFDDMTAFLAGFFTIPEVAARVHGIAESRDVIASPPTQPVDVALLLKAIPCLEQVDKDAGRRLLHSLNARHILISFPVRSLGGKNKGMSVHYTARLYELCPETEWSIRRFEFATELAFLLTKR